MKRKHLLKLWSLALTILILCQVPIRSYAEAQTDSEILQVQELISTYAGTVFQINEMLKPYEMDIMDLLKLPERTDGYYEALLAWADKTIRDYEAAHPASELSPLAVPYQAQPSLAQGQLLADRLGYAYRIAAINKKRDPKAESIQDEAIYMYLSHYLDMPSVDVGDALDHNSDDGYYSAWITNEDRSVYKRYLHTERLAEWAESLRKIVTSGAGVVLTGRDLSRELNYLSTVKHKLNDTINRLAPIAPGGAFTANDMETISGVIAAGAQQLTQPPEQVAEEVITKIQEHLTIPGLQSDTADFIRALAITIALTGFLAAFSIFPGAAIAFAGMQAIATSTLLYTCSTGWMGLNQFVSYSRWVVLASTARMRSTFRMQRMWGYY